MNSVSMWSMWKRVCNFYDFLKHIEKDMKQETQSEKYENNLPGLGRHKKCKQICKSLKSWGANREGHTFHIPSWGMEAQEKV